MIGAIVLAIALGPASGTVAQDWGYPNIKTRFQTVSNALVTDDKVSTYTCPTGQYGCTTQAIMVGDFGFDVPMDARVIGIQVEIAAKGSEGWGWTRLEQVVVSIPRFGNAVRMDWRWLSTQIATYTYGSAVDTYSFGPGEIMGADVNDPEFMVGAMFWVGPGRSVSVDSIKVTVFYQGGSERSSKTMFWRR